MNSNDEMKLTYSSVLVKDGHPVVHVRFDRGTDFAEGILPACEITSSKGFTAEERSGLEDYLKANRKDLLERAKAISGIIEMLK